ncbi:MAG TPA: hypothetical protein VFS38_06610, partial [Actinomycetota bacterium]|nr:hypothetical protein [Actinomycetota bacterium]
MQPTPRPQFGLDPPSAYEGRALPPLGTVLALLALLAAALILTRVVAGAPPTAQPLSSYPPKPAPTLEPAKAPVTAPLLTRRQAIARYRVLDALRRRAYRERDVSLVTAYLTPDSGLQEVGVKEIGRLRSDGLVMRPRTHTRRITIRSLGRREIVVRHVSVQDPRFFSKGKDITIDR